MQPPGVSAVVTKVVLRPGVAQQFAAWQSAFTRAATAAPDFVSIELVPTFAGSATWQIIQRFRSPEALALWTQAPPRAALMTELAAILDEAGTLTDEPAPDFHSAATVTEVIATTVRPGQEDAYHAWSTRIQQQQAVFPGYMGTLVQAPLSQETPYWTELVRFAAPAQLEAWLASAERKALLNSADPAVSTWRSRRMESGFAGWFATAEGPPPPAWKQTTLVLLVLYPVVMLEIRFLSPLLAGLPGPVATFIGNAISVALVSWPLMAGAIFCLRWWLYPGADRRRPLLGVITMIALYTVELLIFSYLL